MDRKPMIATAMKPVDLNAMSQKSNGGTVQGMQENMMTKPPKMPGAGSNPSASEMTGPYGGKKPQS